MISLWGGLLRCCEPTLERRAVGWQRRFACKNHCNPCKVKNSFRTCVKCVGKPRSASRFWSACFERAPSAWVHSEISTRRAVSLRFWRRSAVVGALSLSQPTHFTHVLLRPSFLKGKWQDRWVPARRISPRWLPLLGFNAAKLLRNRISQNARHEKSGPAGNPAGPLDPIACEALSRWC